MTNEVVVNGAERSIDNELREMIEFDEAMQKLGVKIATTVDGKVYTRDRVTSETIISRPGLLLVKDPVAVTITMPMPGAAQPDVLAKLNTVTQAHRGAVIGLSQQRVSELEAAAQTEPLVGNRLR